MPRVVICGTHPYQFNGYSKVVYELCNLLSKKPDIDLHIFAFQNFYNAKDHAAERLLTNVTIFDAHANEEPKNKGFGESLIKDYLTRIDPDIVIIYNDLVVIQSLTNKINTIENRRFKLMPYVDIVYNSERNNLIKYLNRTCDGAIMFTQHWDNVIIKQGFTKPTRVVEHGFNPNMYFPVPKDICRQYFSISTDDFVIVNLNRNQPRKRWDICLMVFMKLISKHPDSKIKLLIASPLNGSWDLVDIMISECRKYNIDFNTMKSRLIIIQNPQKLTDFDINVMYNLGDIGLNTCDGEGFGLCNFEQAALGIPQVVPHIGGFRDFFDKTNTVIINPKYTFYRDHTSDIVSGEAEVCDIDDYVSAIEMYYGDKDIRELHGKRLREKILKEYIWSSKCDKLHSAIIEMTEDIVKMKKDEDIEKMKKDEDIEKMKRDKEADSKIVSLEDSGLNITMGGGDVDIELDKLSIEEMRELIKKHIKK